MAETKKVSFKRLRREPMCAYCGELVASYLVITEAGDYPACARCQGAVENGLHQCDYTCEEDHEDMWRMPDQPGARAWEDQRSWDEQTKKYREVHEFTE